MVADMEMAMVVMGEDIKPRTHSVFTNFRNAEKSASWIFPKS